MTTEYRDLSAAKTPVSCLDDFAELIKARLTALVVLSALAGYAYAADASFQWMQALHVVVGAGLLAAAAAALNEAMERKRDALMHRTQNRPLPTGRMQLSFVIPFGLLLAAIGLAWLYMFLGLLPMLVGAATIAIYLFIYTPMKAWSPICTFVGAVTGALPPVLGTTAARGQLDGAALLVFAILYLWQLPHFFAIAWLYRQDYRGADLAILPKSEPAARNFVRLGALIGLLGLMATPVLAWLDGQVGVAFLVTSLVLGGVFFFFGIKFMLLVADAEARKLFFASIIYLPFVLLALVFLNGQ
ncbi:MAG: heme o synthase [Verrucomicrobiales bacterium]